MREVGAPRRTFAYVAAALAFATASPTASGASPPPPPPPSSGGAPEACAGGAACAATPPWRGRTELWDESLSLLQRISRQVEVRRPAEGAAAQLEPSSQVSEAIPAAPSELLESSRELVRAAVHALDALTVTVDRHGGDMPSSALPDEAVSSDHDGVPTGSKIWNSSEAWLTVSKWHPAGVVSSLPGGEVKWADVSYMSITELLVLTAVAYPAFVIALLLIITVVVSMFLKVRPELLHAVGADSIGDTIAREAQAWQHVGIAADGSIQDPLYCPPVLPQECLSDSSRRVYQCWVRFCSLIPCWMVFGMPMLMMGLARPYPQEVFAALTLLTSAMIFINGMYMAIFAGSAIVRMRLQTPVDTSASTNVAASVDAPTSAEVATALQQEQVQDGSVMHWVILPQYGEEVEIVAGALRSISQSSMAASSISIVLGMEEREGDVAHSKAAQLQADFSGQFREILVSYHPAGLPNDPPGKASNLAWAFKALLRHLVIGQHELSNVVLTVADADSEFHASYFNCLAQHFLETGDEIRYMRIWQSPVFHVKNYHRQPAPVLVGTMFTAMQELAALADPNAVRFPYSSYSLSLALARRVGGWDAEWIAEDYHMGIKCFLLSLGRSTVEPILVPTINYTPEADTYLGTVWARWTQAHWSKPQGTTQQAKRHALGFSDFSYFFMMLPLLFSYATTQRSGIQSLQAFWSMATYGVTLLIRLVNIHVIIGILSTYTLCTSLLKMAMLVMFSDDRNVDFLFSRTSFCPQLLMVSSSICTVFVSLLFISVYSLVRDRVEGEPERYITSSLLHWARNAIAIVVCGPFYFLGLGICIWKAALNVAISTSFEYEVAPKPTAAKPAQ
mmetsp:Transcript_60409/g.197723  ORF Transcript_60409/g.197723 Transcript_60409/m.197723 type:complete len:848 (+) Transcript_60409:132-2675(+)